MRTEIQIDRTTLPPDGAKVKWQSQNDFDNDIWKEGTFCDGDDLFLVGFENSASKWDSSWDVLHWELIEK